MGMSTHIYGVIPADAQYKKMAAIWHQCEDMGVKIPNEVIKFFNGETPDNKGVLVDLKKKDCCAEYTAEMCEGVEIDISRLPTNVKFIRFYNSF